MYCPECGCEYRDGFSVCADCQVGLIDSPPGEVPNPDLEIVTVMESEDPVLLSMAKAILEEAGIPFYIAGDEPGARMAGHGPFRVHLYRIQVAGDCAAEARRLLVDIGDMHHEDGDS